MMRTQPIICIHTFRVTVAPVEPNVVLLIKIILIICAQACIFIL